MILLPHAGFACQSQPRKTLVFFGIPGNRSFLEKFAPIVFAIRILLVLLFEIFRSTMELTERLRLSQKDEAESCFLLQMIVMPNLIFSKSE